MYIRLCASTLALALASGCATAPAPQRATAPAATMPEAAAPAPAPDSEVSGASAVPVAPAVAAPAAAAPPAPDPARVAAAAPSVAAPVPSPEPNVVAPVPKPAPASEPGTHTLQGRLDLLAGPRQKVAPGEIGEGLVYFLPDGGTAPPTPGRFTVSTRSKGFSPNHLVVPVGSTVSFPNRDTILHNVYSRTPGSTFNLGTYGPGDTRQAVLKKAGLVIVNCNVHPGMRTNVVVLGTPHYTRPGRDGSFRIRDVPTGPGTLVFWHPRANAGTLPIKAGRTEPVVQRLLATKARLEAPSAAGN